ncbi:MAG: FAD binding domain-containing protein [Verrucomicrobia bacterium]|nr:FAD binding domain-containing protein [Verrucomicrobiota bacterium]
MAYWTHYHSPQTIEETLDVLTRYEGRARMIGGGTDLILDMQQGHHPPVEALVELARIDGLKDITEEDGFLIIGGAVPHTQLVQDARVARYGTCLVESCGVIGGPQVRNVGTLAGNVAHALPAGDGTIGLLALGGDVEIADADGLRWVPMAEMFLGPGRSAIDSTKAFISRLRFPKTGEHEGSAFRRVMRPQGVALPMISMAGRIRLTGETVESVRISIGPAGPTPFLAEKTMAFLAGKKSSDAVFAEAASVASKEASLRTSKHRASSEYRHEMIRVQLPKVLAKAAERARTGKAAPEGVGL